MIQVNLMEFVTLCFSQKPQYLFPLFETAITATIYFKVVKLLWFKAYLTIFKNEYLSISLRYRLKLPPEDRISELALIAYWGPSL